MSARPQDPVSIARQLLPHVALDYRLYHDAKLTGINLAGPWPPAELKLFHWIDSHPEAQRQLDHYHQLAVQTASMDVMKPWDGIKHPNPADQVLMGLHIATGNVAGAVGLAMGRHLYPHDVEMQHQVGRLFSTWWDASMAAAEAYGAGQAASGWHPGAGRFDLHANGRYDGWGGGQPTDRHGIGVPNEPIVLVTQPTATGATGPDRDASDGQPAAPADQNPAEANIQHGDLGGSGPAHDQAVGPYSPADANYSDQSGTAFHVDPSGHGDLGGSGPAHDQVQDQAHDPTGASGYDVGGHSGGAY